jgi:hypothetical protein
MGQRQHPSCYRANLSGPRFETRFKCHSDGVTLNPKDPTAATRDCQVLPDGALFRPTEDLPTWADQPVQPAPSRRHVEDLDRPPHRRLVQIYRPRASPSSRVPGQADATHNSTVFAGRGDWGARNSTWPGHPLAAADDAGNRCQMVRVAVGRSGNELVGKVEASQRLHRRHLKGVVQSKIKGASPGHVQQAWSCRRAAGRGGAM